MEWPLVFQGEWTRPPEDAPTPLHAGDQALVKGSFEVVTVLHQEGENVLVERAGGQTTYHRRELEPYSDLCPLP